MQVLFAGEATSPNHFSTVHGAMESGVRAADEIYAAPADNGGNAGDASRANVVLTLMALALGRYFC